MRCHYLEPTGRAQETLERHLPGGIAWDAWRTVGKVAYRLMQALARPFDDASEALCRLALELSPYSTTELLPEWETALSLPDACLPPAETLEQRRARLVFRLSKRRWSTAQDWHDLAELFGLQIVITPGWHVQKPALYPASYPKRYDLFPKLGRFRVYINIIGFSAGGYDYGVVGRGPGYPIPYGSLPDGYDRFRCIIERVRPANVVVIWNAPLHLFGFCIEQAFAPEFSGEFC